MGLDAVVHRQTEPGLEPMVDVVDVHKSFGRTEVLKGINLSVAPGEVVCIVGPSGSGKSTLLRLVNFLETLDRGLIFVDGEIVGYQYEGGRLHDRKEADVARMRCQCCMVFQQFNLFGHMTALENVLVGPCACWTSRAPWPSPRPVDYSNGLGSDSAYMPTRAAFLAGNSNVSVSPGHSSCTRRSCCSTSQPARSTRNGWARCSMLCGPWPMRG